MIASNHTEKICKHNSNYNINNFPAYLQFRFSLTWPTI